MAGLDPAMRFPSLGDNPLGKVRGFMGAPSPSKESDFGGTTQCLGWLTESPNKGATHAVRITKPGTSGYRLDRFSSALDLFAGCFEPPPLDRLGGGHASQARQHLNRARRSTPRHRESRQRHLDRQFHELRSRLQRLAADNPATLGQPSRPKDVTHVLGTYRYPWVRSADGGGWRMGWDSNPR